MIKPEQILGQLLGHGKSWKVVEARFKAESSILLLEVEETSELWHEESPREETPVYPYAGPHGSLESMDLRL